MKAMFLYRILILTMVSFLGATTAQTDEALESLTPIPASMSLPERDQLIAIEKGGGAALKEGETSPALDSYFEIEGPLPGSVKVNKADIPAKKALRLKAGDFVEIPFVDPDVNSIAKLRLYDGHGKKLVEEALGPGSNVQILSADSYRSWDLRQWIMMESRGNAFAIKGSGGKAPAGGASPESGKALETPQPPKPRTWVLREDYPQWDPEHKLAHYGQQEGSEEDKGLIKKAGVIVKDRIFSLRVGRENATGVVKSDWQFDFFMEIPPPRELHPGEKFGLKLSARAKGRKMSEDIGASAGINTDGLDCDPNPSQKTVFVGKSEALEETVARAEKSYACKLKGEPTAVSISYFLSGIGSAASFVYEEKK
jgi:hypothetical protein